MRDYLQELRMTQNQLHNQKKGDHSKNVNPVAAPYTTFRQSYSQSFN